MFNLSDLSIAVLHERHADMLREAEMARRTACLVSPTARWPTLFGLWLADRFAVPTFRRPPAGAGRPLLPACHQPSVYQQEVSPMVPYTAGDLLRVMHRGDAPELPASTSIPGRHGRPTFPVLRWFTSDGAPRWSFALWRGGRHQRSFPPTDQFPAPPGRRRVDRIDGLVFPCHLGEDDQPARPPCQA